MIYTVAKGTWTKSICLIHKYKILSFPFPWCDVQIPYFYDSVEGFQISRFSVTIFHVLTERDVVNDMDMDVNFKWFGGWLAFHQYRNSKRWNTFDADNLKPFNFDMKLFEKIRNGSKSQLFLGA